MARKTGQIIASGDRRSLSFPEARFWTARTLPGLADYFRTRPPAEEIEASF